MLRDCHQGACLTLASVMIGWLGWSGEVLLLPLAMFFPFLWSLTARRWQAFAVSLGYFLAASRGLPEGVAQYFSTDLRAGLLLWLTASIAFVFVHVAMWTVSCGWSRSLRYAVAAIVMVIPPFGIMGWAHPLTAAGVLFPDLGWYGLFAMGAGLVFLTSRHRVSVSWILSGIWILAAATWRDPPRPDAWRGIDLVMGASLGRDHGLARHMALIELVQRHPAGTTVVLPESALGYWTPTIAKLWQHALAGRELTVVAGAVEIAGSAYDNVLVQLGAEQSHVLYRQRMPVPGAMWQPWASVLGPEEGARAHMFDGQIVVVGNTRLAALICYELLITWPVLHSMMGEPELILAVGNGWWTSDTSIVEIQRASAEAWRRLFGLPLILSFNY